MKSSDKKEDRIDHQKFKEKESRLWSKLSNTINKQEFSPNELDEIWIELLNLYKTKGLRNRDIKLKDLKNKRWTANHVKIKYAIDACIRESCSMPSAFEISRRVGLSRQTVSKHLKEFDTNDLYFEEMKAYKFASNMLLERIFSMASRGDLKAMKFFISIMEQRQKEKQASMVNNFIQVNNIFINENSIKSLPENKRKAIEEIILSENLRNSTLNVEDV